LDALGSRLQVLADALDVLAPDEDLDRLRARRRRPETGALHRLAQLLVVDQLAGGLHRGEQRRLGVAGRRLRHLVLDLGCDAAHGLALLQRRDLAAFPLLVLRLPFVVRLDAVPGAPAGLEREPAAHAETLFLGPGDDDPACLAARPYATAEE